MTVTQHRRAAGYGRLGGFTWTAPNGIKLFIPWRDLLENGRPSDKRFAAVRDALYAYDRKFSDPERDRTVEPPLPTPHAEQVHTSDDTEFEAELAERLAVYRARTGVAGD